MLLADALPRSLLSGRALLDAEMAEQLVGDLHRWGPPPFPACPAELEGITSMLALEDLVTRMPDLRGVFGRYRAAVTELEAQSASRLEVLVSTARKLLKRIDVASSPDDAKLAEQLLGALVRHLTLAWNIAAPPHEGDLRKWSSCMSRRYDLLPNAWREL